MTTTSLSRDTAALTALLDQARGLADRLADATSGAEGDAYCDILSAVDDALDGLHALPDVRAEDEADAAEDVVLQAADAREQLRREYAP